VITRGTYLDNSSLGHRCLGPHVHYSSSHLLACVTLGNTSLTTPFHRRVVRVVSQVSSLPGSAQPSTGPRVLFEHVRRENPRPLTSSICRNGSLPFRGDWEHHRRSHKFRADGQRRDCLYNRQRWPYPRVRGNRGIKLPAERWEVLGVGRRHQRDCARVLEAPAEEWVCVSRTVPRGRLAAYACSRCSWSRHCWQNKTSGWSGSVGRSLRPW
jgi:hypothetical protein